MSHLPGNPHYESSYGTLVRIEGKTMTYPESENTLRGAQVTATLALAYEQRTANLIATLQVGAVDMTDWPQQVIDNFHRTSIEISQRMGIEGATK